MDLTNIDKSVLKSIIQEIIKEDPRLFKEIIKEILVENQVIAAEDPAERRKRLEDIIDRNFDKYDTVFKKLA